jgi:hypothetical protein
MTLKGRLSVALSQLDQETLEKIVKAHADSAAKGDTRALLALTRLIEAVQGKGAATDAPDPTNTGERPLESMSPAERQAAMALLIRRAREQEEAALDESDPRDEDEAAG